MNDELLPLSFDPVSNGEYLPPPKGDRDREAERRIHRIAERHAARTGVTRRTGWTDAGLGNSDLGRAGGARITGCTGAGASADAAAAL